MTPFPCVRTYTAQVLGNHPLERYGIASQLGRIDGLHVVGEHDCSQRLIQAITGAPVDIAILDVSLESGREDSLALIRTLRRRARRCRLLVMSAHASQASAAMALAAGAHGFISKTQTNDDLVLTALALLQGRSYLHPQHIRLRPVPDLLQADDDLSLSAYDRLLANARLSDREQEVLRRFLEGSSTGEIAHDHARRACTVSNQKRSALRKLGLRNLAELFRLRHALASSGQPRSELPAWLTGSAGS